MAIGKKICKMKLLIQDLSNYTEDYRKLDSAVNAKIATKKKTYNMFLGLKLFSSKTIQTISLRLTNAKQKTRT